MSTPENNTEHRLRAIVFPLVSQSGGSKFVDAASIPADVALSELGLTSIDFLDLIMEIEKEFKLEILDTIAPDELPQTLDGWRQYLAGRLAAAR